MDTELSVQQQDSTRYGVQRFLPPESKHGLIYSDNSLNFIKACEDLSWNHDKSTPHRSERAVRRVKEGTSTL